MSNQTTYSIHADPRWRQKVTAMSEQIPHLRGCPAAHHRPYQTYGPDPDEGEPSAIEPIRHFGHGGVAVADVVRCQRCGQQVKATLGEVPPDPGRPDWIGPLPAA
jgi:hypothetical protein